MKPTERPQYVSQINAFHRFTEGNYLPPNARLLWFSLMDLCNRCGWKEWLQIDTFRIMAMLGVHSQNAALRARDALVDAGLLLYKKGGKGCPNQYRLLFFPCDHTAENGSTNENANGSTSGCPSEKKADDIIRQEKDKRKTREDSLLSAGADRDAREAYAQIVDAFNRICVSLPQVQALNDRRKQAIRAARRTVESFGGWDKLFRTVEASDFLCGRSGAWNGCGFDWILRPANLIKITEGNYTDKPERKECASHGIGFDVGTQL